jgi:PhoPQ-activated pathogenicity-related protein
MCVRNGVVGAALYQVPNQPLTVYSDPWHKENRVEDSAIAITWWKFAQDPSKPEWILELPMTKAGVRALDVISAVAPKYNGGYNVTRFIVAGASKRGWTTWLVGAVDTRVIAIIPIVLDALHVHRFIHRQITYYGAFSFALQDYVHANITSYIDTPVFTQLMQIVDPYFYLHRLTMPKLAINAVGDEFQMPDDQRHWAHDAPGMMQTLMVKNAEHSLATGMFEVLDAAAAFVSGILAAESSTRRAVQPLARAEHHNMPRLERYRQSVSDLRRASGLPVVASNDLTPAARPSAASARLMQERARAVSAWYQMPTFEWEIDNVNGAIHVYTSEPPAIVDIAWTDSPTGVSAGKRDFRWAADNTSWCPVKVFGACVRPVIWLTTKQNVTKVTDTHYMGQVDLPPAGLWRAFIVEVKFANPNIPSAEYWFATPASVVPNTAPFPDCYGLECTDRMC